MNSSNPEELAHREPSDLEQVILRHSHKDMRIRAAELLVQSSEGRLVAERLQAQSLEQEVLGALKKRPEKPPPYGHGSLPGPTTTVKRISHAGFARRGRGRGERRHSLTKGFCVPFACLVRDKRPEAA